MILFKGRNFEHQDPFQYYSPDAVHLVTGRIERRTSAVSTTGPRGTVSKGDVQSIGNLFESSSIDSLLSCVCLVSVEQAARRPDFHPIQWA